MTDRHSMSTTLCHTLSQFPLLQEAYDVTRSSRTPKYFERGDQFARIWAQPLAVIGGATRLSGTNMVALDKLFESASSTEELDRLFTKLQSLAAPDSAAEYLQTRADNKGISLAEAVEVHIAFLTSEGHRRCVSIGPELASQWLCLWQQKVEEQNSQQVTHSALSLTPYLYTPDVATTFDNAIEEYLSRFGETGALSVAVIGAFPFSQLATSELLGGVAKLLIYFAPLFRLAQDVQFEPQERLNAGIYAIAAERNISLGSARELLQGGMLPTTELERWLWACWEKHSAGVHHSISHVLDEYNHSSLHETLGSLSKALHSLAQQLAQPWKF